jgi:predicted  nucleic acid-binding Zn-ribbon protein
MAEVEYKGLKLGGNKLFVILPLIGTLIGGLWGGFELYNRLLDAEEKLAKLSPTKILNEVESLRNITDLVQIELKEDIDKLESDLDDVEDIVREVEDSTAETQREVRNDVFAMESDMQDRFKEMDKDIREMRDSLEDRIEQILENPLNDVE